MRRLLGIALGLFLAMTLLYLAAESMGWTDEQRVRDALETIRASERGALLAAALLAALLAADLFLPVPSSLLMTLAGALFGIGAGAAISLAGAMGSALLGFGLCRRFGRPAFARLTGAQDAERIETFFRNTGAWAILLSRSVPMLTEIVSCLAGLSGMRARLFLALSLAGTAPVCLVYAWAGHTAGAQGGAGAAVLVAFLAPAAGFALLRALRRRPAARPA